MTDHSLPAAPGRALQLDATESSAMRSVRACGEWPVPDRCRPRPAFAVDAAVPCVSSVIPWFSRNGPAAPFAQRLAPSPRSCALQPGHPTGLDRSPSSNAPQTCHTSLDRPSARGFNTGQVRCRGRAHLKPPTLIHRPFLPPICSTDGLQSRQHRGRCVDRTTSELAPQLSRRPSRVRSTTCAGAASTAADACALLRSLLGFELLLLERDDDDPQRFGDGQGGV